MWSFSTGVNEGHQAPPIVNNGMMFVTTPQQQVFALNAKTGDLIWHYKKDLPEDLLQLHPTNRGVALWRTGVYLATVDAHLIALDAKTGKVVWDTTVDNYKKDYYFTLAPLIAKGKVMVGTSGGELGIRGYIAAFDAQRRQASVEDLHDPGSGRARSRHLAGRHLEDRRRLGVAHRALRSPAQPELLGDRQCGAVAGRHASRRQPLRDVGDRARRRHRARSAGHHQYHWNDSWDWDEVSTPLLIDFPKDGRTVKGLVHPGRNGYLWRLERGADSIKFVDAQAVRHPGSLHQDRSGDRTPDLRHRAEAAHGQRP